MRVFCTAGKYADHWVVEAESHGNVRVVHSGPSVYAVLRWAKLNGYYCGSAARTNAAAMGDR